MNQQPFASFEDIDDAHVQVRCDYVLVEILLIIVCAVLSGAELERS